MQDRGHRRTPGLCERLEAAVPPWWRGGEVVGASGNDGSPIPHALVILVENADTHWNQEKLTEIVVDA